MYLTAYTLLDSEPSKEIQTVAALPLPPYIIKEKFWFLSPLVHRVWSLEGAREKHLSSLRGGSTGKSTNGSFLFIYYTSTGRPN